MHAKVSESDFRLALTLQSQRRLRDAEAVYLRILGSDRFNVRALEALGRLRLQQKRYSDAEAPLRTLVKRAKGSADAHHLLGFVLTGLGDWSGAVRSYQKALILKADFPEARNNLGYALMQTGRPQEALFQFEKAIELLPVFPDAQHNRGGVLVQMQRPHEALAALQSALEQKPTHLAARSDLANLLADLRHGEDGLLEPPMTAVDVDTLNALGSIYLDRYEYDLAKRTFQSVRLRDPTSMDARIGLADACQNLGDFVAARHILNDALREGSRRRTEVVAKLANLTFATPDPHLVQEVEKISAHQLDDKAKIGMSFASGRLLHLSGKWPQAWVTLFEANRAVWETVRDKRAEERADEERKLAALRAHTPNLADEDRERPILLFILGTSRSGKTMVESMLSPILDVHRGMENLLVRNSLSYARRNAAVSEVDAESNDSDEMRSLFRISYFEALERRACGRKICTSTNPGLIRRAAWLADTLPNTRFLFVTRNTEDTAFSLMLKHYKAGHFYSYDREASFEHIEWYERMMSKFTAIYPGISRSVCYDEVVDRPDIVYRAVGDLCNVSISEQKALPILADDRSCAQPYISMLRDGFPQRGGIGLTDAAPIRI